MSDNVKIVGYAQRVFYDNGIEYRNFSDDLVGLQSTSNGGTTTFTSNNFIITTSIDTKPSKFYLTNKFSPFLSLNDLDVDEAMLNILTVNQNQAILNLDKSRLTNYAYFGSLREFIRVSLEKIIINWVASIKVLNSNPALYNSFSNTIENYNYNSLTNISTFTVPVINIQNRFNLIYNDTGTLLNTFNETNDLRNITDNYSNYVVDYDDVEYEIVNFIPSSNNVNFLTIEVIGELPIIINSNIEFHIKPNKKQVEIFFNSLNNFESYLLNRQTIPKYTAVFEYTYLTDLGSIIKTDKTLTWPVTDGWNIDFDTSEYLDFVEQLLELADGNDLTQTDLMTRFLTAESISDFDTVPVYINSNEEYAGQKMNKTLKIYGREFDEIKKYIDSIAFADIVTYNKKDNTPDIFIKNLGRIMGWDIVSSIMETDIIDNFMSTKSTYDGLSVGLSSVEAEIELWRRLILNSPWIWKSKGTRKVIEFLFKFMGCPKGLIEFNEYVYKFDKPIDIVKFKDLLSEIYDDTNIDSFNVDNEGYPKVLTNTPDMYFQTGGLWYRETGGDNAIIDILEGNNPHMGPYDNGQKYFNQFKCLLPDFEPTLIENDNYITTIVNLFSNYNNGTIDDYEGDIWVDVVDDNNMSSICYDVTTEIIKDPKPSIDINNCGCEIPKTDNIIRLSVKCKSNEITGTTDCGFSGFTLDPSGYVVFQMNNGDVNTSISQECCESLGFIHTSNRESCLWNDKALISYNIINLNNSND